MREDRACFGDGGCGVERNAGQAQRPAHVTRPEVSQRSLLAHSCGDRRVRVRVRAAKLARRPIRHPVQDLLEAAGFEQRARCSTSLIESFFPQQ